MTKNPSVGREQQRYAFKPTYWKKVLDQDLILSSWWFFTVSPGKTHQLQETLQSTKKGSTEEETQT